MKRALPIFLVAVFLGACQSNPAPAKEASCSEEAAAFLAALDGILYEWQDRPAFLSDIAGIKTCANTSSVKGAGVCIDMIDRMGEIKRLRGEVDDLATPDCAADLQRYLTRYMDASVEAYQAFAAQQPDLSVEQKLEEASGYREKFYAELARVRATPAP